jgi:hypothetical protein
MGGSRPEQVRGPSSLLLALKNNLAFASLGRNHTVQIRKGNSCQPGERFAIVDDLAPVRFLTRNEFESLKKCNPRLIEMRAGDIHYLTELPAKS